MRSDIRETLRPAHHRARSTPSRRTGDRGFTLIEIVVVLLIITITVGLIGVNLGRGDANRARDEADRAVLLLQAARDEAILQGKILAVEFHADGYRFLRVNDKGRLVPIEADDTLAPHVLPDGVTLSFDMDGASAGNETGLILEPSGSFAAFTLTLRAGQARWLAQGSANGRIRSLAPEDAHAG